MTPEEYKRKLKERSGEIKEFVRRTAPRIVGVKVANFLKANYRNGGYSDSGFHKWPITKRQQGTGTDSRYGALLSRRNRMFSATNYEAGDARVAIYNDTPYASIHNDGGTIHPTVTKQMRKFFWAMYYKTGGAKAPEADKYKWLALTKKSTLTVHIPQRKFIYVSRETDEIVHEALKKGIKTILIR